MSEMTLRKEIIAVANAMSSSGLSPGKSGNVSARYGERILITPTGVPYARLKANDIVALDGDGNVVAGSLLPSSEWHFHVAIYKAHQQTGAVVHTHSLYATALACARRDIPAFHYMVAVAGGDSIRCAPYATFGTAKLARVALAALDGRRACLLANHGQIALGDSPGSALDMAHEVETLAAQYATMLQIGKGCLLQSDEMARVLQKFKSCGQQKPG